MACTPKQMGEAIVRNLKTKTGKDLAQWHQILQQSGIKPRKESIAYLKAMGLGHIQAQTVFDRKASTNLYDHLKPQDLFDTAESLDLYQYLEACISAIDQDVRIEPCKTYIPFYRKNQFAIAAPTAQDQVQLGLALPADYQHPQLLAAGSFGTERINLKIKLGNKQEVDDILGIIKVAYQYN